MNGAAAVTYPTRAMVTEPAAIEDDTIATAEAQRSARRPVALLVSAGAVLLAGAHLIWPDLRVDAVTLVLIAIAAAPWLGPIFKSIELPGGWKFEYQQIQREVREVRRRVEEVESLVFTGDTTPELERKANAAVHRFAAYLRGIDAALDVPLPSIDISKGLGNAQYLPTENQIQIDPEFADDEYAILREYLHHVLTEANESAASWNIESGQAGLQSGVADYLVASFTNDPGLGAVLARHLWGKYGEAVERQYVRNLDNERRFDPAAATSDGSPQSDGEVWGAAFWDLRQAIGQTDADKSVIAAWIDLDFATESGVRQRYVSALLDLVGDRVKAEQIFERRGLTVADRG